MQALLLVSYPPAMMAAADPAAAWAAAQAAAGGGKGAMVGGLIPAGTAFLMARYTPVILPHVLSQMVQAGSISQAAAVAAQRAGLHSWLAGPHGCAMVLDRMLQSAAYGAAAAAGGGGGGEGSRFGRQEQGIRQTGGEGGAGLPSLTSALPRCMGSLFERRAAACSSAHQVLAAALQPPAAAAAAAGAAGMAGSTVAPGARAAPPQHQAPIQA